MNYETLDIDKLIKNKISPRLLSLSNANIDTEDFRNKVS